MVHPCPKCPASFDNEKSLVGHISAAHLKRIKKNEYYGKPKSKKTKPRTPAMTQKSKSTTSKSISSSANAAPPAPEPTIEHEFEPECDVNKLIPQPTTSMERFSQTNRKIVSKVTTQINMGEISSQQVVRTERQIERFDPNTSVLIERITEVIT